MITETGQNVQLFAEEELRLEPGLVQTQLLSLVGILVLERELIHETAIHILVEVTYKLDKRFTRLQDDMMRIYSCSFLS